MIESTFTLHLLQQASGKIRVKAVDDLDNYQFEGEYDNLALAAVEGVIALNSRRMNLAFLEESKSQP